MNGETLGYDELREHITIMVHNWMAMGSLEGVDDPALADVITTVRGGMHFPEAAQRMEEALNELVTYHPERIMSLMQELMPEVLALADWEWIVGAMRRREA